ncbi:unnamed protein product [Prorocentrum cordatum]|uniref:Pru domain-containing protein n=1 Tax=Prorocentrum cordatum TaxID=2364126 RepID=A0ABN9PC97_9DINO|nr:unnamed protein product [Polarella glacialis]
MFQPQQAQAGEVHVEFRAGQCKWDGRLVTPEKSKGKVALVTTEEDGLMHFRWANREKNDTALDLIVINDAYFEKIEKCKDGRVYVLRFTSSDKKLIFWMQEPDENSDVALIKKFNDAVGAKIPEKGSSGSGSAPVAAATASSPGAPAEPNPELQAILQQFLQAQSAPRAPPVPLSAVLTTEVLQGLLEDEAAVKEMTELLPATHRNPAGVREALASPQLQQSLQGLSQAIHSDQLPMLLAALGLDPRSLAGAAPGSDALEVLCKAMEEQGGGGAEGGS